MADVELPDIITDDTRLTRRQLAAALTRAGYPISYFTLNAYASTKTGPRYNRFGRHTIYRWADALAWADERVKLVNEAVEA